MNPQDYDNRSTRPFRNLLPKYPLPLDQDGVNQPATPMLLSPFQTSEVHAQPGPNHRLPNMNVRAAHAALLQISTYDPSLIATPYELQPQIGTLNPYMARDNSARPFDYGHPEPRNLAYPFVPQSAVQTPMWNSRSLYYSHISSIDKAQKVAEIPPPNIPDARAQPLRVAQLKAEANPIPEPWFKQHFTNPISPEKRHKRDRSVAKTTKQKPNNQDTVHTNKKIREKKDKSEKTQLDFAENDDSDNEETVMQFKQKLTKWFRQMMFVSGETVEPGPETTWMIEEIVREQVVEMLREATGLANRRGSKSISIVDLIFQIRHNPAKVSRLKTFLSWKDVRKNVKDSEDKAGADADALDLEDGGPMGANPAAPQKTQANKKAKLILPWEVQSYYSETVPEREDEEDEEEEEQNEATLARLASADERTKNMTKDEYVYWSECRQASFTFRKGKRFREWAGFGTIIDSKPNDDVVDILGFLTFEIVQTLTEEALRVKNAEDLANKKAGRGDLEASKKRKREVCSLFEMPEEGRTPVEPRHVQEAFRRLQLVPNRYKFMRPGLAGVRTPLRMI